jgi:carbon storage regulator
VRRRLDARGQDLIKRLVSKRTDLPLLTPLASGRIRVMLVLNRKVGERIVIGDDIVVTVVKVQGKQVRIGIEAPTAVSIRRKELLPQDMSDADATLNRTLHAVGVR